MCKLLGPSIRAAGFAVALACSACGGGGESRTSGQAGDGQGGHGGAPSRGQLAFLIEAGGGCTVPGDCKSGFCFDGVCCRSDCAGLCQSCAVAGSIGTCTNIPVGADPRNDCPDEGVASCGRDGFCDGTGACALYAAGAICRAQSCAGSVVSHAARCDGAGTCGTTATDSCGPYMCNGAGDACRADCATNADCIGGAACVNGSCGPKPPGAPCGAASDCGSGFCVEGVCCTTACNGTCRSCAIAGSEGQCIAVPAGGDPLDQCADAGAASCGNDGACDGAGACRRYASGTVCAAAGCSGSTSMPARTCNGSGTCLMVVPTSCGAYICASTDACRTSCAAPADCAAGNVCVAGGCVPPSDPDGGAGGAGGATGSGGTGGTGGGAGTGGTGQAVCAGYAFCDDFEDGDAAGWFPLGGTWSIVSDGSSVYRGANGSGNSIAGSVAWTDQTVEARVKVVQFGNTKAGFRGGVIARHATASNFYAFLYDGTGGLRLLQNNEQPGGHTGSCGRIDANLTAGSWHTLRLSVSGPGPVRLQTFLDGTMIHDCTGATGSIPAGAAGTYVYGANTIVEFDDVKVSTP